MPRGLDPPGHLGPLGCMGGVGVPGGLDPPPPTLGSLQVTLELEGEVTLALCVLSAPCQALHEFLGGYLCLGGRQPGQPLDLRLFHKLTGGQEPL